MGSVFLALSVDYGGYVLIVRFRFHDSGQPRTKEQGVIHMIFHPYVGIAFRCPRVFCRIYGPLRYGKAASFYGTDAFRIAQIFRIRFPACFS